MMNNLSEMRRIYLPLLVVALVSLLSVTFPLGQPATVYAAPDTESLWSGSNSAPNLTLDNSAGADGSGTGTWADATGTKWASKHYSWTFVMGDSTGTGIINSVTLYLKHYQSGWADDSYNIEISSDGINWTPVQSYTSGGTAPPTADTTDSWGVSAVLDTWTKIDAAQVRIYGYDSTSPEETVDWFVDTVELRVDYTIVAPTVTTQAATSVEATTATGNGNITATGGENPNRRGFCYMVGTSGDPTIANSVAYDDGSFTAGEYTKAITGLTPGTNYRVRAYAVNSAGTGYGTTVQILTKPAAPTGVTAADGDHTDKVVVTWLKSTGATGYRVYRDAADVSGLLSDVATYDDTGAAAPTITPGTAAASDGTYAGYVALSLSGQSANNGTTHTYKVVAVNATGNSADSSTDTGYRGVGSLTYQWQRSAADSDENYSNIDGATTASYNDTGAPADGIGRYYKCIENATGASQQPSTADRGYRTAPSISNTPGNWALGTVDANSSHETGITYSVGVSGFQITNSSTFDVNITIKATDMGSGWLLADTGDPDATHYTLWAGTELTGGQYNIQVTSAGTSLITVLASSTRDWGLKLMTPTTFSDGGSKSGTVTLTATQVA